jgi:mannose-6-phosphate isomerase-like protein (cupin superfamily)
MAVRRVITETVNGRSRVASDSKAITSTGWDEIWHTSPDYPLGRDSAEPVATLEPPSGVIAWRTFRVPPDSLVKELLAAQNDVLIDADGFHQTNSVDFIYILEGTLSLRLDDDEVELHAGDCVVQRATNHAWHNYSDTPVHVLGVMVGLA